MSSITYSERIKIETFCELGLSNIQMGVRLNRSPSTISYELSRCQPYQAELALHLGLGSFLMVDYFDRDLGINEGVHLNSLAGFT